MKTSANVPRERYCRAVELALRASFKNSTNFCSFYRSETFYFPYPGQVTNDAGAILNQLEINFSCDLNGSFFFVQNPCETLDDLFDSSDFFDKTSKFSCRKYSFFGETIVCSGISKISWRNIGNLIISFKHVMVQIKKMMFVFTFHTIVSRAIFFPPCN